MNCKSQDRMVERLLQLAFGVMVLLCAGCSSSSSASEPTTAAAGPATESPDPSVDTSASSDPTTGESDPPVETSPVEPRLVDSNNQIPLHGCANDAVLVACSSAHDTQNYAVFDSPADTYDPDALSRECYPYFLEFTGTPIGESGLSGETWYPPRSDWDDGNRSVQCLVLFDMPAMASLPDLDLAAGFAGRIPWSSLNAESCVQGYSDFDLVSVQTTSCTGDALIDILGLVDIDDAYDQCQVLVSDAGAEDEGQIEYSWLLEARGYTKSICYRQLTEAP